MTEAERAAVRSRPFAAPACQPILERLEWKAWSTILWGLDEGDPKVIRLYLDTFRRMPDGSIRARPLPRVQLPAMKPIRPPTVEKLIAQDRRRAREAARVLAAEAIVADVHARGADTYAALAAVLPRWRKPPTWKHRSHRPYRSYRSDGPPRLRGEPGPGRRSLRPLAQQLAAQQRGQQAHRHLGGGRRALPGGAALTSGASYQGDVPLLDLLGAKFHAQGRAAQLPPVVLGARPQLAGVHSGAYSRGVQLHPQLLGRPQHWGGVPE